MASKSQRRKERHEKKRRQKREKQAQARSRQPSFQGATMPLLRSQDRMERQHPQAWAGEMPEDVAVFDDSVLSTLPTELAQQVTLVRDTLQAATQSRGEEALKSLASISRGSPLSEWRLFLRGFVDWLANRTEAAGETWKRLDPERRPGRIATAMMLALRSDLQQLAPSLAKTDSTPPAEVDVSSWEQRCDDTLLYHAKLLRRVRFDRAALQIAEAGVKVPEEKTDLLLGPRKLQWLTQFYREYHDTEPELTTALAHAALARTFAQNYIDMFEIAVKAFPGPRHDPRNLVLTYLYYNRFESEGLAEHKGENALGEYLNRNLPANKAIPEQLRGAIASQIHCYEANAYMQQRSGIGMLDRLMYGQEDSRAVRTHLKKALKAFPTNLDAYKAYVGWIDSKLDDDRMTQAKRKPLEEELAGVMRDWSTNRPNDVEPRLWLVDHLLENEQMAESRPHVDFLAAARQDNPRVRATPWKWQLLEAMRLCRRKAWLTEVPARLNEAEALWPAWMSRQWLPYLKAAWLIRSGETQAFESERQQIREASGMKEDSLADACMMLGAAQRMRVPADVLKQLRAPVDHAVKNPDKIPLDDYVAVAGFFWDLHRAQLLYPAYRMHGGKFGQTLLAMWSKTPKVVLDGINDERIHKAVLWCSEYRFWASTYNSGLPACIEVPFQEGHPFFIAARVNAFLKQRYQWGAEKHRALGSLLRETAGSQRDPYYRYWFQALAEELDDAMSRDKSQFSGFPFGNIFNFDDDDDEDDFDDEDDDDDDFF